MRQSSVKSLLNKKLHYKVTGTLWIECEGERFIGPGRVELLQKIEETGSINKAAKLMQMSYKKAWEMINALNAQSSKPFVITQAGGEKGGGSAVTAHAKEFITYHQELRGRFMAFLEEESNRLTMM